MLTSAPILKQNYLLSNIKMIHDFYVNIKREKALFIFSIWIFFHQCIIYIFHFRYLEIATKIENILYNFIIHECRCILQNALFKNMNEKKIISILSIFIYRYFFSSIFFFESWCLLLFKHIISCSNLNVKIFSFYSWKFSVTKNVKTKYSKAACPTKT